MIEIVIILFCYMSDWYVIVELKFNNNFILWNIIKEQVDKSLNCKGLLVLWASESISLFSMLYALQQK